MPTERLLPLATADNAFAWGRRAVQALVLGLAAVLLLGSGVGTAAWLPFEPNWKPMNFQAALAVWLLAAGWLVEFRRPWTGLALTTVAGALALIPLLHYLTAVQAGWVSWAPAAWLAGDTPEPMVPATALALTLLALAGWPRVLARRWPRLGPVAEVGQVLVLSLAAASLLSGALDFRPHHRWANYGYLTPQTACLLILLTLAQISSQRVGARQVGALETWAPMAMAAMLTSGMVLWNGLLRSQQDALAAALAHEADTLAERFDRSLTGILRSVDRMAERWQVAGGLPQSWWQADAQALLRDLPGLVTLQQRDLDDRRRWSVPDYPSSFPAVDPNAQPRRRLAYQRSREQRRAVLSQPFPLLQGGIGVLYFVPLAAATRDDGTLAAAVRLQTLIEPLLPPAPREWRYRLRFGDEILLGDPDFPIAAAAVAPLQRTLASSADAWSVQLAVAEDYATPPLLAWLVLAGSGMLAASLYALIMSLAGGQRRLQESRRAQHALAERESQLSQAQHLANLGLWDLELASSRMLWSAEMFRLFELDPQQPPSWERFFAAIHPDDREHVLASRKAALEQRQRHEISFRLRMPDGRVKWLQQRCEARYDAVGRPWRELGTVQDISERVAAEQRLRASEHLLGSVVDHIPTMVFMKRADDLRFVLFNRAGEQLLGIPREEMLGRNDYDFFPREQAEFFTGKDREVLAAGFADVPEESIDTRHQGRRVLHTRKVALRDDHGRPQYLLGVSLDITERKRVEDLKSEFVSTVSHELRTPLTSIAGALGLIGSGRLGALPDAVTQLIEVAVNNCGRLRRLIDDLLDFEKLASGEFAIQTQRQPLAALIEQSIDANRAYATQYGVTLRLIGSPPTVDVDVDGNRLLQVLANLISNAAKFSPAGASVELSVDVRVSGVRVEVRDHGRGIPESFRDRVFQKFSQADGSDRRERGGTGLGLAISKALIERMHGRIGFDSEPGSGSTFWFELPSVPALTPQPTPARVGELQ